MSFFCLVVRRPYRNDRKPTFSFFFFSSRNKEKIFSNVRVHAHIPPPKKREDFNGSVEKRQKLSHVFDLLCLSASAGVLLLLMMKRAYCTW